MIWTPGYCIPQCESVSISHIFSYPIGRKLINPRIVIGKMAIMLSLESYLWVRWFFLMDWIKFKSTSNSRLSKLVLSLAMSTPYFWCLSLVVSKVFNISQTILIPLQYEIYQPLKPCSSVWYHFNYEYHQILFFYVPTPYHIN